MGDIAKESCVKFYRDLMRMDGAFGFFKKLRPPNNKNRNKMGSVQGPVPGPTIKACTFRAQATWQLRQLLQYSW